MRAQADGHDLLGPLLARPAFRADLLYFIRLAGNYAAHIFADVRNRAPLNHRKAFDEWLAGRNIEGTLKEALPRHDRWFDAFKRDFAIVLEEMPPYMRDRLASALAQDHVIPWDLRNFIRALDDLREYRHWLEHAGERIERGDRRPRIGDHRLLEILGLMLLPFLTAHLLGRIRHHGLRAGLPRGRVNGMADNAKAILDAAIARRREASRFINGLKRRTSHEDIAAELTRRRGQAPSDREVHKIAAARKRERADLENRKAALIDLHRRCFSETTWPRYNLENFLIRFGFIGRARIGQLERLLGIEGNARPDFINAIEPAFMLSMDIALILHGWLTELEEQGVDVRKKAKAGEVVVALRNTLAHGGWFWDVFDFRDPARRWPFAQVLCALLKLPETGGLNDGARWRNDLLTRLEGALRPCRWAHAYRKARPGEDPNQMPARHVIRRWTDDRRARFADRGLWHVEKRAALRRLAARWMRDLATARDAFSAGN